ncbi:DnaD domain-containing protein [Robertmurraya kyonggiensis]|uniref:DnaD domain protein n=1 Tax=Robertmurraya kyonggiensis TaxID=1037680 RepID=A0A4U1DAS7_9BACI|nr:DnaD domain-containing protein [Robertmurraya kyonggiensis]TKC19685.1 DnaD domain protein [Robertmurraya kyonggiensis]
MNKNLMKWVQEGNITIPRALLTYYKELNINEEELVLLLHVFSFLETGNDFPTPPEISTRMTISVSQCSELLRKLIQKGFITIEDGQSTDGIRYEKYSIEPLWEKLVQAFLMGQNQQQKEQNQQTEMNLYTIFEQEFGRPLSPFECETLALWIDDDRHEPLIIKAALREAVISGKLNFRYIDRILFEWKKNGIKTIEQAKSYGNKFRQHQTQQPRVNSEEKTPRKDAVPFYNWLEQ